MVSTNGRALLVGATGLIGRQCMELLCGSERYSEVIVLVRRETGYSHGKKKELVVDFDHVREIPDTFTCNDVFCCLGTTIKKAGTRENFRRIDHDYPLSVARIAKDRGAQRCFIVSAMGANSASPVFYNRVKGDVENDLRTMAFESLHIFRPSLLLGKRQEFRLGERIAGFLSLLFSWFMRGPLRHYRPVKAALVAGAMVKAAESGDTGVQVHLSGDMQ